MHASSLENMQKCFEKYLFNDSWGSKGTIKVVDIGGANVNGSYHDIFSFSPFNYIAVDIDNNSGVDIVLEDSYSLPFEKNSIDIIISGQTFEHSEYFWELFSEMVRVVTTDGLIFLIAPSAGPEHKYPVDCYRFYPDSFKALAKKEGIHLLEWWLDERGPWKDLVGIFSMEVPVKFDYYQQQRPYAWPMNDYEIMTAPAFFDNNTNTQFDEVKGSFSYLDVLKFLHKKVVPNTYLEIGVKSGNSFKLAECTAVGVDPQPDENCMLPRQYQLFKKRSDIFFEYFADELFSEKMIDLAFIDGMHLFEFVLRDFINVEKYATKKTVVVIDDVLPNHTIQANRRRFTRVWTGDVWKIHHCLKKHRPDLTLSLLDASPAGLLVISGLTPGNRVLIENYNPIINEYKNKNIIDYRDDYINRNEASSGNFRKALECLGSPKPASSGRKKPLLSFVIAVYNMARELPRTLHTLKSCYQKDIRDEEIEIIVVDNGSAIPVKINEDAHNVRLIRIDNASPSPSKAMNIGLSEAKSDLICGMIDGARMLSPGICKYALKASRIHSRPIISTLGFHLGEEVQMESVKKGYNQQAEDHLLKELNWQGNGYRLFTKSAFAGSSSKGWFSPIAESNALIMPRILWDELHGFDEHFSTPGGGLVNLDTYRRACELPDSELIVLLGEGSFHQVHGGIATNQSRPEATWEVFHNEYEKIRMKKFKFPEKSMLSFGNVNHFHYKTILDSCLISGNSE